MGKENKSGRASTKPHGDAVSLPADVGDYEVGYCRPPKASQFKPGQSGNKRGRPKAAVEVPEIVTAELNQTLSVIIDGRRQKMKVIKVLTKKQIQDAMKGKHKALEFLLRHYRPELVHALEAKSSPSLENLTLHELLDRYQKAVNT